MKTSQIISVALLIASLGIFGNSYAQTYSEEKTVEEQVVEGNNLNSTYLQSLGVSGANDPRSRNVQGNSVFLTQIGEANTLSVTTSTVASDINVTQDGDNNFASMTYVANTAVANLVQRGNSNQFTDFVNNRNLDVTLDLVQDGNNLKFQREGVNDLTKSINFKQTEGTPNLIIRSFN
tara:strand:+ start:1466 stop:1999 length:534 start_codon:yes stop_codon:yes gene_type:complete